MPASLHGALRDAHLSRAPRSVEMKGTAWGEDKTGTGGASHIPESVQSHPVVIFVAPWGDLHFTAHEDAMRGVGMRCTQAGPPEDEDGGGGRD